MTAGAGRRPYRIINIISPARTVRMPEGRGSDMEQNENRRIFLNIRTTLEQEPGANGIEVQADDDFYMLSCTIQGDGKLAFGIKKTGEMAFGKASIRTAGEDGAWLSGICARLIENNANATYTVGTAKTSFQTVIPLEGEYDEKNRKAFDEFRDFTETVTGFGSELGHGNPVRMEYREYEKQEKGAGTAGGHRNGTPAGRAEPETGSDDAGQARVVSVDEYGAEPVPYMEVPEEYDAVEESPAAEFRGSVPDDAGEEPAAGDEGFAGIVRSVSETENAGNRENTETENHGGRPRKDVATVRNPVSEPDGTDDIGSAMMEMSGEGRDHGQPPRAVPPMPGGRKKERQDDPARSRTEEKPAGWDGVPVTDMERKPAAEKPEKEVKAPETPVPSGGTRDAVRKNDGNRTQAESASPEKPRQDEKQDARNGSTRKDGGRRTDDRDRKRDDRRKDEPAQSQKGNIYQNYDRDLKNLESRYRNQVKSFTSDDLIRMIENRHGDSVEGCAVPDYIREALCGMAKEELRYRLGRDR